MAHVQDRWYAPGSDGKRKPTARHGQGKRWLVWYQDSQAQRRTKAFDRRVDADRYLAQVVTDVVRGDYIDPERGRRSFGAFAREWLAAHGCHEVSYNSSMVRGMYDLVFAYEQGDLNRANFAAGTAVRSASM